MKRPIQFFRAGVGAVIANRQGRVLVCERTDVPGAWQFPQGGLEAGEAPLDAAAREAEEETGVPRRTLRLRRRYPEPLAYELPVAAQSPRTGMGQVQYWFLFTLADETAVQLPPHGEFRAAKWVTFDQAVARTVGFRRALYRHLRREFQPVVAGAANRTASPARASAPPRRR